MRSLRGVIRQRSTSAAAVAPGSISSAAALRKQTSRLPVAKLPPLPYMENFELRKKHLGPALSMHYQESERGPLKLSFGQGQYLYDDKGERYLDCVNNVCHIGHCHPRTVQAAATQLAQLNTNSRYLHDNIVRLGQEITSLMPDPLEVRAALSLLLLSSAPLCHPDDATLLVAPLLQVAIFVNSGSEANDLALRLARNYTGRKHVFCVEGGYHGNTASTLAISPYNKYGPTEAPEGVVRLMSPDQYRHGLSGDAMTAKATAEFAALLESGALPPAAFIVESLICCGGQVVPPDGYLRGMHELVRRHGGVAIADEVQTGFGRVGSHMWAFESHGATPDIVTLGKPFGNGFPLSAVITTREIAESSRAVEYFNTFGGNPVACAVGLEVLRVIDDEELQENAHEVGEHTMQLLRRDVAPRHSAIGDVRGMGLLIGVEFVTCRETREPDAAMARHVMHWMRDHANVLVSTDGPHRNVVKIKPPLCFSKEDGEHLARALDGALAARP